MDPQQGRQQSLGLWQALFSMIILLAGFVLGTALGLRYQPRPIDPPQP